PRDWRGGSHPRPRSPCRRTSSTRGRSPGPSATCCWARSRSSPLRSFGGSLRGIDRRRPMLGIGPLGYAAEIDFFLDALGDAESRRPKHRLGAGTVRHPPVGPVVGILLLDEVELGEARLEEDVGFRELVILIEREDMLRTPLHRLEQQQVAGDMLTDEI